MNQIRLSDKILPHFYDFWKACGDPNLLNIVAKGGRNSSKSTTTSIRIIYNRMKYRSHALVIRKIDKTLRKSCREQLIWAIHHLGVQNSWKWSKADNGDMTLRYVPTGTCVFFEGANNPDKIKSFKTSEMPVTDLWFEELAEFRNEEEISVITNSILRAELDSGLFYKFFFSYNPPKRKQNWVNKKYNTQFVGKNTFIHHSTYLDNKYVSSAFIEEAEEVKSKSEHKYKWIYLGEPIGGGVVPFDNLVFRTITDEEVASFDNIRQGIDWGYAADPFAFVKVHYDKTRRKLYLLDEIFGVKMSNREVVDIMSNLKYHYDLSIADCADPKSIAEMSSYGVSIKACRKGPGSVEYGEKWLDDLDEIVIDYDRTPNAAREFENIDYQTDKDGNVLSKLEDKDNHTIDALRYAMEDDMRMLLAPLNIRV